VVEKEWRKLAWCSDSDTFDNYFHLFLEQAFNVEYTKVWVFIPKGQACTEKDSAKKNGRVFMYV